MNSIRTIVPAVPCTSNPISFLPNGLALPNGRHASDDLMTGNEGTVLEPEIRQSVMYYIMG